MWTVKSRNLCRKHWKKKEKVRLSPTPLHRFFLAFGPLYVLGQFLSTFFADSELDFKSEKLTFYLTLPGKINLLGQWAKVEISLSGFCCLDKFCQVGCPPVSPCKAFQDMLKLSMIGLSKWFAQHGDLSCIGSWGLSISCVFASMQGCHALITTHPTNSFFDCRLWGGWF